MTYNWTVDNEKPVLEIATSNDPAGACNPTITAPTFKGTDNCEGAIASEDIVVTTTGPTHTGCSYTQSWTANYTDGCGNSAIPVTVTYTWTVDVTKPVIATTAVSGEKGCDPASFETPVFTVSDNCEGDFTLSASNVTDGGTISIGTHKWSRTWTAHYTDGCGNEAEPVSVTYTWTVAPEISISCPPDVTKTLAYGDCVMDVYPAEIGTPIVNAPSDWPMEVSNDIPADNLYQEGETIITWTATDQTCGYSVSCEQKVIVVFPQCPDAVDCEGNVYHGVRIDCECWTQTNLVSNCYGDAHECELSGTCDNPIPCVFEYSSNLHPDVASNVAIFGKLYCDTAALGDSVVNEHGHIRGICPEGWYLPTPEQYEQLNLHGADALRTPDYWVTGAGDNSTGFSWLPAGWYNGALQRFEGMGTEGYFWSTEVVAGEVHTVIQKVSYECDSITQMESHSGYGISVRCIKEKE